LTRLCVALCAVYLLLLPTQALAHHLEVNQLALRPVKNGELRGRFLLAPRTFSASSADASPAEAEQLLLSELRSRVELSVAGVPCTTAFTPIEVWREASPSPGHLVDVRCPAPQRVSPTPVSVFWRGPAELSVTYPRTETTGAVSLDLDPGGRGTLLATAVGAPPGPVVAGAAGPPGKDQRLSVLALTAGQLAVLLLALAVFQRRLGAQRRPANARRAGVLRAGTLSIVALGALLFALRMMAG
jgi:hypothetical protein